MGLGADWRARGVDPSFIRGAVLVSGIFELAAGLAIGLLIAAAASWVMGSHGEQDDWRQAVVGYMELYTPDTFVLPNPDSAAEARQLQAVSAKIGVDITPDKVAVPGLRYRTAFNLSYDGAPLAGIAYTHAGGAPVLFCVIANGELDAPPRTIPREGGPVGAGATCSSRICPNSRSPILRKRSRPGFKPARVSGGLSKGRPRPPAGRGCLVNGSGGSAYSQQECGHRAGCGSTGTPP